jgi:hypothetical protein
MNNNLSNMHRSGFVRGYVPVGITRDAQEALHQFRLNRLRVDLRIERALITAAAELAMKDASLRSQLQESAAEMVNSKPDSNHSTASVLIRKEVKRDVRTTAQAWGFQGADQDVNTAMVSTALSVVLKAEALHKQWIEMVSEAVKWEVANGYQSSPSLAQ